jgi:thiamine biosynthesis lipoprotein ApbE
MRRVAAAALLAAVLAGCSTSSDDARVNPSTTSAAPVSTVERDASISDDEITQATADVAQRCAAAMAALMHFDVSWITSSTPPATVAKVDPDLLATTQQECAAAKTALDGDLDPTAGSGWAIELGGQIQSILDGVNAAEVNLAPDTGLAMALLNIQGMVDGSFFGNRPGLIVTP